MAIAQAHSTSQESNMADNEVEIGLLLHLSRRNRRIAYAKTNTRKPEKGLDKRHCYEKKDTRRLS